ncbi:hypothetical protein HO173_011104 [Letharia columbiana]|uniref:Uncharacterized protein n=1 Tax=Letharia columbiana TaxID=112416 RepID=A0A8H6L059_9LECA|nr:uncharacterized protein HO173_011104 [Letharia columbiana]KAF6230567.1 hypothetical protein HO173_011104 [Letharia columbiana]
MILSNPRNPRSHQKKQLAFPRPRNFLKNKPEANVRVVANPQQQIERSREAGPIQSCPNSPVSKQRRKPGEQRTTVLAAEPSVCLNNPDYETRPYDPPHQTRPPDRWPLDLSSIRLIISMPKATGLRQRTISAFQIDLATSPCLFADETLPARSNTTKRLTRQYERAFEPPRFSAPHSKVR